MIVETKLKNFKKAVQGLVNNKAYSLLDIGCGVVPCWTSLIALS